MFKVAHLVQIHALCFLNFHDSYHNDASAMYTRDFKNLKWSSKHSFPACHLKRPPKRPPWSPQWCRSMHSSKVWSISVSCPAQRDQYFTGIWPKYMHF